MISGLEDILPARTASLKAAVVLRAIFCVELANGDDCREILPFHCRANRMIDADGVKSLVVRMQQCTSQ